MNLIVHAELGWLLAQGLRERRDRILVTAAGVVADLDALSLLGGVEYYGRFHHLLTHGFLAAAVVAAAVAVAARSRWAAAAVALGAFHLHLLCDLAGSGPGWPIFYLWPVSDEGWLWRGQWDLASWQNGLVALVVSTLCLLTALRWRRTIVEVVSRRADRLVVRALRERLLGEKPGGGMAAGL